jgi:hypothetical protein
VKQEMLTYALNQKQMACNSTSWEVITTRGAKKSSQRVSTREKRKKEWSLHTDFVSTILEYHFYRNQTSGCECRKICRYDNALLYGDFVYLGQVLLYLSMMYLYDVIFIS